MTPRVAGIGVLQLADVGLGCGKYNGDQSKEWLEPLGTGAAWALLGMSLDAARGRQ